MQPAWARSYLGIPFQEKGRTRTGLDCYGLVRLVFHEQLGIELPSYAEDYATTTDAVEIAALFQGELASQWHEIPLAQAQLFDVVILRILGEPIHFALVLDPPYFLHVFRGTDVTVERWDSLTWQKRLVGVVRFEDRVDGSMSR